MSILIVVGGYLYAQTQDKIELNRGSANEARIRAETNQVRVDAMEIRLNAIETRLNRIEDKIDLLLARREPVRGGR